MASPETVAPLRIAPAGPMLSILVPVFNEAEVLAVFFERLERVLESHCPDYEILCVDDGSRDETLPLLRENAKRNPRIRVIAFSRNFGKEAAMTAALDYANGRAVIPMDADLQDPPELIPELLRQWQAGFEVVYARRSSRSSDSFFKQQSAALFYRLFNRLSDTVIPANVGDFRLMDRKVVDVIRRLPERDRFMKALYCWPGYSSTTVDYERTRRAGGSSKFNAWGLFNFALSGITSFSTVPIRAGTWLGLLMSVAAFGFAIFIIIKTMVFGSDVPGYASLMVTLLFIGGLQLFFLGLLGEYLGRIYKEVKQRPLYVVAETIGLDEPGRQQEA